MRNLRLAVLFTLELNLMPDGRQLAGPATGHLDTDFLGIPVLKQMLPLPASHEALPN